MIVSLILLINTFQMEEKKCAFKFSSFQVLCVFYFFALVFKVMLWTDIAILPQIWDHIFKTVFSKQFFCFVLKAQIFLQSAYIAREIA